MGKEKDIKVSAVIVTYNRGDYITDTLSSLATQTLPAAMWELLVVNNNSTDNTESVVERFASRNPEINVRLVNEARQGVSHARSRGVTESWGEYIVYVDDDEVVNDRFLQEYYDFFESHPAVGAAGGRIVPMFMGVRPRWMSPFTERPIIGNIDFGKKPRPFPAGRFFGGGNMGIRRAMFDKYGLFNASLGRVGRGLMGGEEKDFYMRMKEGGEEVWYLPGPVIEHVTPPEKLKPEYFRKLTRNIGRSERVRTLNISKGAYAKRLAAECVKWGGAFVLSLFYLLTLRPAKGRYLLVMRWQITRGLLEKKNKE